MSKKKKRNRPYSDPSAYSGFTINQNKTLGPEASYDETSYFSQDATGTNNLADEVESEDRSHTSASLVDKYLLSGKYEFPIWRIVFLLLAVAFVWIFIVDNNSGAFNVRGDWWAIIWTAQKCLSISFLVFVLLILHSLSNWLRSKSKKD